MKDGLGEGAPGCSKMVVTWCHLQTRRTGCEEGWEKRVRITTKKKRSSNLLLSSTPCPPAQTVMYISIITWLLHTLKYSSITNSLSSPNLSLNDIVTCLRAAVLTGFRGLLRKSQLTEFDSVLLRSSFVFTRGA